MEVTLSNILGMAAIMMLAMGLLRVAGYIFVPVIVFLVVLPISLIHELYKKIRGQE